MNWFTNKNISHFSKERKAALAAEDGACEHVEADASVATNVRREMDSFGTVGSYVCCEECNKKAEEADGEQEEICHDCQKVVKMKDAIEWKWWDFHAPQGDEPVIVCNDCRSKPTHIERVRRDRADLEEEERYQDQNSNYDR